MVRRLKDAIDRNRQAAEELDAALRECLTDIRDRPETVVEGRFRVINGGRSVPGPARAARLR